MRISDGSSDVCSSDLAAGVFGGQFIPFVPAVDGVGRGGIGVFVAAGGAEDEAVVVGVGVGWCLGSGWVLRMAHGDLLRLQTGTWCLFEAVTPFQCGAPDEWQPWIPLATPEGRSVKSLWEPSMLVMKAPSKTEER